MSRPEHQGPPELYYNDTEALKYTQNSRIIKIQKEMAFRAIDLLEIDHNIKKNPLILDIGCGSGLTGSALAQRGCQWIGMDISLSMLNIADQRKLKDKEQEEGDATDNEDVAMLSENNDMNTSDDDRNQHQHHRSLFRDNRNSESEEEEDEDDSNDDEESSSIGSSLSGSSMLGDLFLQDMGQGIGFRPGTFDGAISISALQWLFHANKSYEVPYKRILRLFTTLHAALSRNARAIFQFYPENQTQTEMLMQVALKAGFGGGIIIDHPDSLRRKKYFLCLMTGGSLNLPRALEAKSSSAHFYDEEKSKSHGRLHVQVMKNKGNNNGGNNKRRKGEKFKIEKTRRELVLSKKELYRKKGKENIPTDSKYTGRKRRIKF